MLHGRFWERGIVAFLITILLGLIILSFRNYRALEQFNDVYALDGGIWNPTQIEREWLRLRGVVERLSLADPTAVEEYPVTRDVALSRVPIMRDSIDRFDTLLTTKDKILLSAVEQGVTQFQQQAPTDVPDPAEAEALLPLINTILQDSRALVNERRDSVQRASIDRRESIDELRFLLIGMSVALLVVLPGIVWLTRRRLDTSLQYAYTTLKERSTELEQSQTQLAASNTAFQQQNQDLEQTLAQLQTTIEERSRLETTVQRLRFPIIPVIEGAVVLPLVGRLNEERMQLATERILEYVEQHRVRYVLFDLTGVSSIEEQTAHQFQQLVRASTLLGVQPVLVGVSPMMAEELVHVQFDSSNTMLFPSLQQAVMWVLRS